MECIISNATHPLELPEVENTIFGLQSRNRLAEKVIGNYAKNHRWLDVGVGVIGTFVPIPGASLAAMLACVAAQGPFFYKPMAKELGKIYLAPMDHHAERIVSEGMFEGAGWDIGNEFTASFLAEIAGEIISEMGWGAAAAAVPFIGGMIGATLDAFVATTMTWRVGTMVSVYYQNGGAWLGSRRESFEVAKDFVGKPSLKAENRVNLDEVAIHHKQIIDRQLMTLKSVLLDPLLQISPDEEKIRSVLMGRHLSEELVEAAILYVRGVIGDGAMGLATT
jgi:hypothetical protein